MTNVIPFDRFDRRATHRIFSEPVALEYSMNVDATSQEVEMQCRNVRFAANEVIDLTTRAHMLALATGDTELVRLIVRIHDGTLTQVRTLSEIGSNVVYIRRCAQEATALALSSEVIDPYQALDVAGLGPEVA